MKRLYIEDRQGHGITHREYTDEGFLRVPGRVAKTGTQQYLRRELGLDGDPNEIVVVYRPPEEVFKDSSLATYNGADVTVLHPKKLIDSKSFKETSVGVGIGSGRQDGDFVVVDLIIKDAAAIKQVQDGLAELSAGYTAEYFDEKGTAPDGTPYDYVQRDIRINHIALVPAARAGRQARLFDENPNPEGIKMKVTLDSGSTIEVQDEAAALLLNETIKRLKATADEATKAKDEAESKAEKAQAKADAMEEEKEKKKGETSDAIISERLKEITEVKDKAHVIDAGYTADSIDPVQIMRGVMAVTRSTVDWAAKSDDYVRASFDIAHEEAKSGSSPKSNDQRRQLALDASKGAQQVADASKTARDSYIERMTKQSGDK